VDHLKPMVLLSLNTGLRRGELFDLAWRNIDFKTRVLTVVGTSAKSGRTRHIPLNDESHETLRGWKAQADATDGLVFPSESGEPFDNVNKSWAGVLREAKITNFRWHDMRHHFASRLAMAGVDLNTIRELLGHSELTMTLRYAHLAPEHKAEAVARLMHPPTRMNSTTRGDEQEREP
jgi:integrase